MLDYEALAKAALHPLQVQILERAAKAPEERFSAVELADEFDVKLPNISYHVRVLGERGLLKKAGTKQRRGAIQHYYKLAANLQR
jgi:DNA-binding transcriptional ArsR family regulator